MVVGVIMAFRVRDPLFDFLWSTDWGTMIWLGFLFSVAGYALGTIAAFTNKKMMGIGASLAGQPPSLEQAAQMGALQERSMLFAKVASLLVVAAVAVMAMAQHV